MRVACIFVLAVIHVVPLRFASAQTRVQRTPNAADDPFVGTWRLNLYKSRLGRADHTLTDERTYSRYGDSVIVDWAQDLDGRRVHGSYAAKCNGRLAELPNGALLVCRYKEPRVVEGEIHDRHDPGYVLSPLGVGGSQDTDNCVVFG